MSLRNELQSIYEKHGVLTAALIVDEATKQSHPLHNRFEWDNKVAGDLYRLNQATELIQSVKVRYRKPNSEEEGRVRFYHAIRTEKGHVFHSVDDIKQNPFLTKLLMAEAERAWRDLYARYSHLGEFLELVKEDIAV